MVAATFMKAPEERRGCSDIHENTDMEKRERREASKCEGFCLRRILR